MYSVTCPLFLFHCIGQQGDRMNNFVSSAKFNLPLAGFTVCDDQAWLKRVDLVKHMLADVF